MEYESASISPTQKRSEFVISNDVLELEPLPVERVWGGGRVAARFGFSGTGIGEIWTASDRNVIRGGAFDGQTVRTAVEALGGDFLGPVAVARYGIELPLITKYLDTRDWLSVQVHPDDDYAHREEAASGDHGKTEAWLFLDVGARGEVAYGLREPLTTTQLRQAVDDDQMLDVLAHYRPEVGQLVSVPAGTLHALGPDLLLFEVQQRSELTYRLYDFGRGRELHLDKALAVANTDARAQFATPSFEADGADYLFAEHDFVVQRHLLPKGGVVRSPASSFSLLSNMDAATADGEPRTTYLVAAGGVAQVPPGRWVQSFMATPDGIAHIHRVAR